jgi:hypothetical protein
VSPDAAFTIEPRDDRPGAYASFPFDREMIGRFRESFPRARFRRRESRWLVPGKTAAARLRTWIDGELSSLDAHADAKGRDAYAFEPLASRFLEVGDDLVVRTPYSRAVIDRLRALPAARWDPAIRAWRLPFRGYEALREAWPEIEAEAEAAETLANRERTPEEREAARRLASDRRRRRQLVALDDPPPLGEPVATPDFGVVVFEGVDLEPYEPDARLGWGHWRFPTWRELAEVEPAAAADRARLWWPPTATDLAERRRRLREGERAKATRAKRTEAA